MYWMIALGVIATVVIEGILQHFNLLVTGDGLMQNVIKPVPRPPPQPVQQLLLLLWKFAALAIERLFGVICVLFVPEIPAGFANHLRHS
jgi:hypothetical protein